MVVLILAVTACEPLPLAEVKLFSPTIESVPVKLTA